jgi:hypothetical protein
MKTRKGRYTGDVGVDMGVKGAIPEPVFLLALGILLVMG